MANSCALIQDEKSISVCLFNEQPELMEIGEKMEQICPEAYMNGYNWDAFLCHYLRQKEPELMDSLQSDPEAGMCSLSYAASPENLEKAQHLLALLQTLIAQPEQLYEFLEQFGEQIEWD